MDTPMGPCLRQVLVRISPLLSYIHTDFTYQVKNDHGFISIDHPTPIWFRLSPEYRSIGQVQKRLSNLCFMSSSSVFLPSSFATLLTCSDSFLESLVRLEWELIGSFLREGWAWSSSRLDDRFIRSWLWCIGVPTLNNFMIKSIIC